MSTDESKTYREDGYYLFVFSPVAEQKTQSAAIARCTSKSTRTTRAIGGSAGVFGAVGDAGLRRFGQYRYVTVRMLRVFVEHKNNVRKEQQSGLLDEAQRRVLG